MAVHLEPNKEGEIEIMMLMLAHLKELDVLIYTPKELCNNAFESAGFYCMGTGGGCDAWQKDLSKTVYLMVCDDSNIPTSLDSPDAGCYLYTKDSNDDDIEQVLLIEGTPKDILKVVSGIKDYGI